MMAKCMRDCGWMDGDTDEYVHDSVWLCVWRWLAMAVAVAAAACLSV